MKQKRNRINIRTLALLWLLLAAGCVLIFHSYLFGNETLVFERAGSDTKEQYIMQYNSAANHLRSGNYSLWDFTNGFGASMFILNLMNPFLMLVYLLGALFGPERIPLYMVYILILEVLAAGTSCYFFLSEFGRPHLFMEAPETLAGGFAVRVPSSRKGGQRAIYDGAGSGMGAAAGAFREEHKLAACFMYAFNGYLMVWGQHYQFGSVLVWLPLLLMFIERGRRQKRALFGVAAMSGILILNGFYQGYMCMAGAGVYVVIRELLYERGAWPGKWKNFFSIAAAMAFGVCMAAVNLLPSAAQISGTGRASPGQPLAERFVKALSLWSRKDYTTLVFRLFGNNLQGRGIGYTGAQNYYEAASWFFSALFVILLFQYLCTIHRQDRNVSQKAAQYVGVLFAVFMVAVKAGSLIFNGFVYAFSRHTFLLMPLFALLAAAMLEQIFGEEKISVTGLVLAAASMSAVYGKAFAEAKTGGVRADALVLCATGLAMAGILAFVRLRRDKSGTRLCYTALMAALFVNVVFDTALTFRGRDTLKKNDTEYFQETYDSSVTEALAWLRRQDGSFYRVEKDFGTASECLDSMAQGYACVSTYNSTQNRNIARFVEMLWPQLLTGYDANHYRFSNTVREQTMAALTGVKYLLSRSDDLRVRGYERYHQIGDISIYRNTDTGSIGKFFTKTAAAQDFEAVKDSTDIWRLLRKVLVVDEKDAFSMTQEELAGYAKKRISLLNRKKWDSASGVLTKNRIEAYDVHFIHIPLRKKVLDRYADAAVEFTLQTDAGTEIEIRMNDDRPGVCYHYAGKKDYRFAVPQGTKQITIKITNGGIRAQIGRLRFYGRKKAGTFSDKARIEVKRTGNDSHLTGSISAAADGIVMLAIPYEAGWSVWLDGERQELFAGDYGFIAFEIKAGGHELDIRYDAPLFRVGAAVSLLAWGLLVAVWIQTRPRRRFYL